jgi:hypothetical protein
MKTDPVCIAGRLYMAWCAAAVGLSVLAGALVAGAVSRAVGR